MLEIYCLAVKFVFFPRGIYLIKNNFSFNGDHYAQINGTAMDPKMAPSYANTFMWKFEKKTAARIVHWKTAFLVQIDRWCGYEVESDW